MGPSVGTIVNYGNFNCSHPAASNNEHPFPPQLSWIHLSGSTFRVTAGCQVRVQGTFLLTSGSLLEIDANSLFRFYIDVYATAPFGYFNLTGGAQLSLTATSALFVWTCTKPVDRVLFEPGATISGPGCLYPVNGGIHLAFQRTFECKLCHLGFR